MEPMELISEISKKYEVIKLDGCKDIWFYQLNTPIMSIRHYFFPTFDGSGLFCSSQKDNFDDNSVQKVRNYISTNRLIPGDGISVFPAKDVSINEFDTVVVLHGEYHNILKYDVPSVYAKIFVVFPSHHTEFLPDTPSEEVIYARNKVVNTLDWNRSISPRVKIWFENLASGVKTIGDELLLSDSDYVFETISTLFVDKGKLVVENFRLEVMQLAFLEGSVEIVDDNNNKIQFDEMEPLRRFVSDFLLKDK